MLTRSLFFLATIVLTAKAATLEKPQITCQLPSCAFMGTACLAQGSTICGPPKDGSTGSALYVCEGGVYIQEGVCISARGPLGPMWHYTYYRDWY
ncbi:hypothetical protein B0H13DRAFT_2359659 [Mycena leptocephala]|nr:hypothetical protein B0H13DRAFT_2359659 [Mycena leptocephala]